MNHHSINGDCTGSYFLVKDPWSALTHFIGFLYAVFLTPVILIHASGKGDDLKTLISLSIFMISMILLYGASTAYHTFLLDARIDKKFKKLDHCMIFILIAGSYTPVCTCILGGKSGLILLIVVWSIAILGIIFKLLWVTCPKWVSSVIYIGMGWSCVSVIPKLFAILPRPAFMLLLIGGLVYTAGGILYACKFKKLNEISPAFGNHEIFHVFVMIGSLCHFMMMYLYV